MEKLVRKIKAILVKIDAYLEKDKIKTKEKEFNKSINGLMAITFNEKNPEDSIKLFKAYKRRFDSELARISLESKITSENIEEYFYKESIKK